MRAHLTSHNNSKPQIYALIGLAALAPSIFMELVGVSAFLAPENPVYQALARLTAAPQSLRLFNLISPMVMIGGSLLALALNVLPRTRSGAGEEGKPSTTTRVSAQPLNLGVATLSVLVLAVMFAYVLGENWQCLIGQKLSC